MADKIFDSAAADLFCNEETKCLCFDDDDDDDDNNIYQSNDKKGVIFRNEGSDSEALIYLPCLSEECISWMVEREREHLPRDDYLKRLRNGDLDISLRKNALDWMFKACTHYNFGELCLCSAMSYFDRFLSLSELPVSVCSHQRGDKIWAIQLVAVACLSLAAKIEEVNVPSTVDLQAGEPRFLFEGKTVQRMEIVVLTRLKWKIKAYTPCNFIDYYLRKMNDGEFPSLPKIHKSLQIISNTIEGIEFLEFRPSEIAAAVALYVSGETQETDIDKALSVFIGVEKGRVVKCVELIQELKSISSANNVGNASVSSSEPHSPNGVLEAACLSFKTDEKTVGSCPSSSHTSPDNNNNINNNNNKRRKLDQTKTFGGHF